MQLLRDAPQLRVVGVVTRQPGPDPRVTDERILEAIDRSWEDAWCSPPVAKLCAVTEMASKSSMHYRLRKLVADGTLETNGYPGRVLYRRRVPA